MLASVTVSSESDLLLRAKDGDVEAYAEFVRVFERRVRALLGRLLNDERDVEEAAQDTFVQAWRNLARFRGDSQPFTWLYRIAVNEALQRTRRKKLDLRSLDDLHPGDSSFFDPRSNVDTLAENRELSSFLAEKLRDLPFEYRAPLVLRDIEGWSNQEVADALDLSLPAAKSRIHRARSQLRDIVEVRREQEVSDLSEDTATP
jgi:RNA polymerase sigma-70 factor (ECF subfamily)